jgi:Protein of unknown function (DUF1579)
MATATETPNDAMQEAWVAYSTPGDMHKMLADESGAWDVSITFWQHAGAEPQTDEATAEVNMIFGGRYQEVYYRGTMMGQLWEGKNTVAFNNKSKEFTSFFIDSSGTGAMVAIGPYDEAAKSINMKGEAIDAMNGSVTKFREVYTFVDDTTRRLEIFDERNGQPEYKSMEIVMKRR